MSTTISLFWFSLNNTCLLNFGQLLLNQEVRVSTRKEAPNGRKLLQTTFVSIYAQQMICLKGSKIVPSSFSSRKLFMGETIADSFFLLGMFFFWLICTKEGNTREMMRPHDVTLLEAQTIHTFVCIFFINIISFFSYGKYIYKHIYIYEPMILGWPICKWL